MTRFATFATLYMTAILMELAEHWDNPRFTAGIMALLLALVLIGVTRVTLLFYLAITTAFWMFLQFPEVANHVNVELFGNVALMLGIGYTLVRRRDYPTDDDCFEMMRPVFQSTAILVYAMAGFHKLNADFFNPDVSCVRELGGQLYRMARSDLAGVPTALALGGLVVPVAYRVSAGTPLRRYFPAMIGAGVVALIGLLILVAEETPIPEIPPRVLSVAIFAGAVGVIGWELIGGLLLTVPRLQAPLLAVSLLMHSSFALIGFVDFGALAVALLYTFVPGPYLDRINQPVRALSSATRTVYPIHLYLAFAVSAGLISYFHKWTAAGFLFLAGVVVLIWPLLSALTSSAPRPAWRGVSLLNRTTPRWMAVFPAVLLLHGLTPYLGLRTTGNFSMFSNLRTEGPRSNHLILGENPLKIWGYEEDVVRVISVEGRAKIGYAYVPLEGYRLPVVEFRKLIYKWTRGERKVAVAFEYRGRTYRTDDIVNDPVWRTDRRDWEMALLDFRVIPEDDAPNRCRW